MSDELLDRTAILKQLEGILEIQVRISGYVDKRLCLQCYSGPEVEWETRRKHAFKDVRGLVDKYAFSKMIPRDEFGILTLSVTSHLLNIQHTLLRVLVMIDTIRGESFDDIFMDSMMNISSKVNEQIAELKRMVNYRTIGAEQAEQSLETILRLEREIDEDNIVICRQISVVTKGESDFNCYMMRKIVAELEHISDYAREAAEILSEM
ncbi:MAG: hypothetical protein DRO87_09840 [Candidatus Thorarchaeota archaeon]|nr:MAG: hypothetical protein DRO87_09840 [Candidatus Thorarchaeota archaeon]RLI55618.1 MAG: hypothetical protein DRP09_09370 [Candidatus Thorarchaeota archaeon]